MRGTWQKSLDSGVVSCAAANRAQAVCRSCRKSRWPSIWRRPAEAKQLIEYGIHFPSKITKTLALPPATRRPIAPDPATSLAGDGERSRFIAEADKAKIGPSTGDGR
jgi:hypothetical protein